MRRRTAVRTMLVAGALVLGASSMATAGGFATVGLSSLPDGTAPGKGWHVTLTILQHGLTPLSDVRPSVRIASADGRTVRTFTARPAARPGTYTADVVFPSAGRWSYSVDDGFTMTHTFAPVAIGSSQAVAVPAGPAAAGGTSGASGATSSQTDRSSGGGGDVRAALGAALAAGVLAAGAAMLIVRRRSPGASADTAAPAGGR
jgi:hypothetical protein